MGSPLFVNGLPAWVVGGGLAQVAPSQYDATALAAGVQVPLPRVTPSFDAAAAEAQWGTPRRRWRPTSEADLDALRAGDTVSFNTQSAADTLQRGDWLELDPTVNWTQTVPRRMLGDTPTLSTPNGYAPAGTFIMDGANPLWSSGVWVRPLPTAYANLPPSGTRIHGSSDPETFALLSSMAQFNHTYYNNSDPVLEFDNAADGWILTGLYSTHPDTTVPTNPISFCQIGEGATHTEANHAKHIVIERCFIDYGRNLESRTANSGISPSCEWLILQDNWIWVDSKGDSQASGSEVVVQADTTYVVATGYTLDPVPGTASQFLSIRNADAGLSEGLYTITPEASYTDLITHGTNNTWVRSTARAAVAGDVGFIIRITTSVTDSWVAGNYTISSIQTDGGFDWWTLSSSPAPVNKTAGRYNLFHGTLLKMDRSAGTQGTYAADYLVLRTGAENQAIAGGLVKGPLRIKNNFICACGEQILISGGGSVSRYPDGLNPSDVTLDWNHFFSAVEWNQYQPATWDGYNRSKKNNGEMKNGEYWLWERNTFENCWPGDQQYAVNLKVTNPAGIASDSYNPNAKCRYVTFRENVFVNCYATVHIGISNASYAPIEPGNAPDDCLGPFSIHDCWADGNLAAAHLGYDYVSGKQYLAPSSRLTYLGYCTFVPLEAGFASGGSTFQLGADSTWGDSVLVMENMILRHGVYCSYVSPNEGPTGLATAFQGGTTLSGIMMLQRNHSLSAKPSDHWSPYGTMVDTVAEILPDVATDPSDPTNWGPIGAAAGKGCRNLALMKTIRDNCRTGSWS